MVEWVPLSIRCAIPDNLAYLDLFGIDENEKCMITGGKKDEEITVEFSSGTIKRDLNLFYDVN